VDAGLVKQAADGAVLDVVQRDAVAAEVKDARVPGGAGKGLGGELHDAGEAVEVLGDQVNSEGVVRVDEQRDRLTLGHSREVHLGQGREIGPEVTAGTGIHTRIVHHCQRDAVDAAHTHMPGEHAIPGLVHLGDFRLVVAARRAGKVVAGDCRRLAVEIARQNHAAGDYNRQPKRPANYAADNAFTCAVPRPGAAGDHFPRSTLREALRGGLQPLLAIWRGGLVRRDAALGGRCHAAAGEGKKKMVRLVESNGPTTRRGDVGSEG